MVKAILDGRKTVTRRVVKPQPPADKQRSAWYEPGIMGWAPPEIPSQHWHRVRCPYGQPGDRLWVREAFAFTDAHEPSYIGSIEYRADGKCMAVDYGQVTVAAPHNCDPLRFDGHGSPASTCPAGPAASPWK